MNLQLFIRKLKKSVLFFFYLLIGLFLANRSYSQVIPNDSTIKPIPIDTLSKIPPPIDSLQLKDKRVLKRKDLNKNGETVINDSLPKINLSKPVFLQSKLGGSKLLANDSLLRWSLYNSLSEFLYWNSGNHHFRTESFIRSNFVLYPAQFDKEWRMDGLIYRNSIGLHQSINLLPFHRVGQLWLDYLGDYEIYSKRFYQIKPITLIEAEESDNGYLSVYGHFFVPITKQQHLELALWNRGEDGYFTNAETQAKNFSAHYRFQFSDSTQIEFQVDYISNQMTEPDGYLIEPLNMYSYDQLTTEPVRTESHSSLRDATYRVDYLRVRSTQFRRNTLFYKQQRRLVYADNGTGFLNGTLSDIPADSIYWDVSQIGLQSDLSISLFGITNSIVYSGSLFSGYQKSFTNFSESNLNDKIWSEFELFILSKTKKWDLDFKTGRSAIFNSLMGFSGKTITTMSRSFGNQIVKGTYFSKYRQQPIYTKYLSSIEINGIDLKSTYHVGGALEWDFQITDSNHLGIELHSSYKSGEYGFRDTTYFVSLPFWSFSTSVLYQFNLKFLQFENNFTATHFKGNTDFWPNQFMLFNRSKLFYQNYMFSKKAYVRTGFSLAYSPFSSATPRYQLILGDWYQPDVNQQVMGYFKLDYEFTARVRSIFFYIRWENLTQGILNSGYMETYAYPMFARRLRFGIKTQFIN